MEVFSGKNNTSTCYPVSIPVKSKADTSEIHILARLFLLSDEEKLEAGIYIGAKGRDWIERAALVIPSTIEDQDTPSISINT